MLVQLTPEQITKHWSAIEEALNASVPVYTYADPERNNNVLEALLRNQMQAWAGWAFVDGARPALACIVLTTIEEDACSRVRNLMIYSLYGVRGIPGELYREGMETLKAFARGRECHRVIALTDNEKVLQEVRMLGGDARWHMITFEV